MTRNVEMLVLSRKTSERICVGGDVFIEVVEVKGDRVKLGITAPRETSVDREEVFEAKLAQAQTKKD
jgi:carbon storage regulator